MTPEYIIAEADRFDKVVQVLISIEALRDQGSEIEDFFCSGCENIREVGRIQIVGDTDKLEDSYTAD